MLNNVVLMLIILIGIFIFYHYQTKKGDEEMIAMLWTQQIMLGKKTFAQTPEKLKTKVKELLIDSGCEELVTEE